MNSTAGRAQREAWALDREYLWHPYTRASAMQGDPFPRIGRGEGVYLFDTEGRRYLDAISSWWCCNLGHGHPRIVEAITRQARELQHSILGNLTHPGAVELASRLAALFPDPCRVLFASDGASAVEAALKIAAQYWYNTGHPERCRFASVQLGYHGDTLGAVSVGYLEGFHAAFRPLLFAVQQAESPCCGTCRHGLHPAGCDLKCFESMRTILATHGPELAAVIIEPLCQGAGGMRIYPAVYLQRLAELCRAQGVLLIVDEIAMGFGRTGRMFAFEHAAISPDLVCLGKGLSGGTLPISATVVARSIAETFQDRTVDHTFYHGHTFAGNPIAAAAALATLAVYAEDGIVEQAHHRGQQLQEWIQCLRGHPRVRDVRCLGMIAAVELHPSAGLAQQIQHELREDGILLRPLGDVIYLMPPLITPPDVLQATVARLQTALDRHR